MVSRAQWNSACDHSRGADHSHPGSQWLLVACLWLPWPLLLTPCPAHCPVTQVPHRFLLPGSAPPSEAPESLRASPGGGDPLWPWRRTLRGRLPLGLGEKHFDVGKPTGQAPGKSPPPREKHRIHIDFQTTSMGALRPVITGDPNLHLCVHASTHTHSHTHRLSGFSSPSSARLNENH